MKGNTSRRDIPLQELKVGKETELLDFLLEKQVRKSRNAIKSLLAHKQINVNGKMITQYNHQLQPGDSVSVMKFDQSRKEKRLKGAKIVFEDDDIVVVDKEAGFLTISTDKEKLRTIYGVLNEYVKKKGKNNRVFVLHRLDREVSGFLVFAKSAEVQEKFQRNWDKVVLRYIYTGVVDGKPHPEKDKIESWLTENKNLVMMSSSTENGGLHSITHYQTIKSIGRYTLLDFEMETRRKNQIRVHMQSIGHPIVGDKKYGAKNNPIKRIALHGKELALKHPMTGQLLEFKSPLPKVMQQLLTKPTATKETIK